MPVKWNQSALSKILSKSKSETSASAIAECAPVVDHLGRPHRRPRFQKIYAYPVAAARDIFGMHAEFAQAVDRALPDLVRGQFAYEIRFVSVVCERYRHVCFSAAVTHVETAALHESLMTVCGKAEHDLAHRNYFCHDVPPYFCTRCTAKPHASPFRYTAVFLPAASVFHVLSSTEYPRFSNWKTARSSDEVPIAI